MTIVDGRPFHRVMVALALVVFFERQLEPGKRLDPSSDPVGRELYADLVHRAVDVFEFPERRPLTVSVSPRFSRSQPDGEGLGKILGWVSLGIPCIKVQNIPATARIRFVKVRI